MKNKTLRTLGLSSVVLLCSAGAAYAAGFIAPAAAIGSGSMILAGVSAVMGLSGIGVCSCPVKDVETVNNKAEDMGLYLRALDCNRFADGLELRAARDPQGTWNYVAPVWSRSRDALNDQASAVVGALAHRFERNAA